MPLIRARVRGIYATALTNILLKKGIQIVQASRIISTRFNIPQLPLPADVTVKNSDDDPSELLVIGYPWAVKGIEEELRSILTAAFYWHSVLPVHATVRAKVIGEENGKCTAKVNGQQVIIVDINDCIPDKIVTASIIKTAVKPGETPLLRPGARIIGDYAIVYRSDKPKTTISEHIRNTGKRAELLALASNYTNEGISVHWRSSAQHADTDTLQRHLRELVEKLQKVEDEIKDKPTGVYTDGEDVLLIRLSSIDKQVLDEYRNEVIPTTPYHHTLKSLGDPELQTICEFADTIVETDPNSKQLLYKSIPRYLATKLLEKKRIAILHIRPNGEVIKLGNPEIKNIYYEGEGELQLILVRRVKSTGIYDGLNVEKEPGDIIETIIRSNQWYIEHRYYNENMELKGIYININTPPEIGLNKITYLDLAIDIVKRPGEKPKVIDVEELKEYYKRNILTDKIVERIVQELHRHLPENIVNEIAKNIRG